MSNHELFQDQSHLRRTNSKLIKQNYSIAKDLKVKDKLFIMTNPKKKESAFLVGSILLAPLLVTAGIVVLVLHHTNTIGGTPSSPLEPIPPSEVAATQIACNFLSIPDLTECRSTVFFDTLLGSRDERTSGPPIPSEIGMLTQLEHFQLGFEFQSAAGASTLPSEIGLLTRLMSLGLVYNYLTSTIPSEIGRLSQLTALSFDDNSFTGSIPSEIGNLSQLTSLWLAFNALSSSIPTEIGLLTQMMRMSLKYNQLSGEIPSEIGLLTHMAKMELYHNQLSGAVPSSLCSLDSIRIFVDCNEITCPSGCCSCGV